MQENRYVSDLSMALRLLKDKAKEEGVSFPEKLSRESLTKIVGNHLKFFHSPGNASYWDEYLNVKGISDPAIRQITMEEGIANSTLVLLSETLALFQGVVIHVEDAELVEALLRTDLDAKIGDVKIPFPIVEFAYPAGIRATDAYQASGTIVVDFRQVNFAQEFKSMIIQGKADPENKADIAVISKFRGVDGRFGLSSHVTRISVSEPLAAVTVAPDIDAVEREGMRIHLRLAMAVLMYLQSVERQNALRPLQERVDIQGLIAPLARIEKRRPRYRVIDVTVKTVPRASVPQEGHHASPEAHWRRGHMRALRDERFKRDDGGGIRVIWVRPTKINAEKGEDVTAERKLHSVGTA